MMLKSAATLMAFTLIVGSASAEPFKEVTVGVPVASVAKAEEWYLKMLGSDVEVLRPVPGVVEFKVAPNVWFQIFESDGQQPSKTTVRFLVDDMQTTQASIAQAGIDTGEAITVPDVVTYSEFADPDGNALGLYDLP